MWKLRKNQRFGTHFFLIFNVLIMSIIGIIFIFGQNNAWVGIGVSIPSIAFAIFLYFLELLVAVLQAYIFTILSALFISDAIVEPHEAH